MATVVGTVVGNALLPGVGGVIGGMIGGLADSYLLSGLSKGGPIEGPRLDDMRIQLRAEGSPIARVHGRRVRLAGVAIWSPLLQEESVRSSSSASKGGPSGGADVTNFIYYMNIAIALADTRHLPGGAASSLVKLWANNKVIYDSAEDDPDSYTYDELRFFTGAAAQSPDSLIVATEGSDTPAYRGKCGVVIERLDTTDYGTNINFEALIEPEVTAPTVGTVIARELELGGLSPDDYDVSSISASKTVEGLGITGPQSPAEVIASLQTAYNLVHSDWGGKIRFYDRGSERTVVAVSNTFKESNQSSSPVKRTRLDQRELPAYISVTFFEASCDFQQSSRTIDADGMPGSGTSTLSLPLVLTGGQASNIGQTAMWSSRGSNVIWEASLPPSFCDISENEILLWEDSNGVTRRLRVLESAIGANFELEASGVVEQEHTFNQDDAQIDSDRTCDPGEAPAGPATGLRYLMYSGGPLHEGGYYERGVYRAWADGTGRTQNRWLAYSWNGRPYRNDFSDKAPTMLGSLVDDLPPATSKTKSGEVFEKGASIRVNMINNGEGTLAGSEHQLQTRTEEEVAGGLNALIVQTDDDLHEVIGYTTATDLGSGLWRLEGLLRGLRGTENQALVGATAGKLVASANELGNQTRGAYGVAYPAFYTFGLVNLNVTNTLGLKAQNRWEVLADKPEILLSEFGTSAKPLIPAEIIAKRDDSGSILIGVRRRPRALWDGFLTQSDMGWHEQMDIGLRRVFIELDIVSGGNVVRELSLEPYYTVNSDYPSKRFTDWSSKANLRSSGLNVFEYTDAEQAEDSVSLFSELTLRARHRNEYGVSEQLEVTI